MKKFLAAVMVMAMLILTLPFASNAQTRKRYMVRTRDGRVYYTNKKPSVYRRHRNAINVAAGTAGGAILGGLIGGKKGAAVGAATGAGGSALYTYKFNKKKRRYYRVRR